MSRTTKCFGNDFKVTDTRGRIIEENHYYAFGLKIAGITSEKFGDPNEGSLKNDYLYNDKELWDDADLNWYDYGFRNYDPQIGRFPQLDPLTWDYPYYTPYQYAGNEPIANVDLDGLEPLNILSALDKPTGALAKEVTLQTVVLQGVKKAVPAAAKTSSTLGKALGTALTKAGTSVASFSKDFWNEGVMPTVDWVNHNVNPVYGIFNGINSQFTGQDFLSGEKMTKQDGFAELAMSIVPGGRGAKVGKGLIKGGAKTVGKFSKMPPGNLTKLKGSQGWRDGQGNIWKKDMKHKDHWDVTDPKTGKKVKEIDFDNNQIWPDGPKNKNKR